MDNYTLALQTPLAREGKEIKELSLRVPYAGDLRGIKLLDLIQGDPAALIALLPRISSPVINPHECNKLTITDITNLMSVIGSMIGVTDDPAGKTQSPTT